MLNNIVVSEPSVEVSWLNNTRREKKIIIIIVASPSILSRASRSNAAPVVGKKPILANSEAQKKEDLASRARKVFKYSARRGLHT